MAQELENAITERCQDIQGAGECLRERAKVYSGYEDKNIKVPTSVMDKSANKVQNLLTVMSYGIIPAFKKQPKQVEGGYEGMHVTFEPSERTKRCLANIEVAILSSCQVGAKGLKPKGVRYRQLIALLINDLAHLHRGEDATVLNTVSKNGSFQQLPNLDYKQPTADQSLGKFEDASKSGVHKLAVYLFNQEVER